MFRVVADRKREPLAEGHPNRQDENPENDVVTWNILKKKWPQNRVRCLGSELMSISPANTLLHEFVLVDLSR